MKIFTIGHSNHKWETFRDLLKQHEIKLLIDTRSKPVSTYAPFSNIRTLPNLLEDEGIVHLVQVCVLNHGEIEEVGKHNDLVDSGGLYAHLYKMNYASIQEPEPAYGDN